MTKKILKVTGIVEIVLALLFLGISFVTGRLDELPQSADGAGIASLAAILCLLFPFVRLIGGVIGIIGRGRKLLIISGAVLVILSIPDFRASEVMLAIYITALVVSAVYLAAAILMKKPAPKGAAGAETGAAAAAQDGVAARSAGSAQDAGAAGSTPDEKGTSK